MNRAFPIAALLTGVLLSYALYQALVVAPTDQLQGDVSHHLLPCALGMDDVRIFHHKFCRVRDLFVSPQRKSRCGGCGSGGSRCRFLHGGVGDWTVVGAPSMGIWWTWDVRLTSTLVLWLIYVSYLVLRRFSSGGQTPVLAAVLAVFGLLLDLVFPNPASVACARRRRIDRPTHVARLADQLRRFSMLWVTCVLVALSAGNPAKGSRGHPCLGRSSQPAMNKLDPNRHAQPASPSLAASDEPDCLVSHPDFTQNGQFMLTPFCLPPPRPWERLCPNDKRWQEMIVLLHRQSQLCS